jgi:hypothetical protein
MLIPKNLDLLQNIEQTIVLIFRQYADLPDYDVDDALAALIDDYRRDADHPPRAHRLKGYSDIVYAGLKMICDARLGRTTVLTGPDETPMNTQQEMVTALTTVRKSVVRHGKGGGRQGYLRFIDGMMP